jgi:hypothetical protein
MGHELSHESVVVFECNYALVFVSRDRLCEFDLLPDQPLDPESHRAGENDERRYSYLASALSSPSRMRPRKERENAAWMAELVTEVEVIGGRIVEVYSPLDEPQPQNAGVEVEISLRIARDTGDVVNAGGLESHCTDNWYPVGRN